MKSIHTEDKNQDNLPPEIIYVLDYELNGMGISAQFHENELRKNLKKIARSKNSPVVTISFIYPHEVKSKETESE